MHMDAIYVILLAEDGCGYRPRSQRKTVLVLGKLAFVLYLPSFFGSVISSRYVWASLRIVSEYNRGLLCRLLCRYISGARRA